MTGSGFIKAKLAGTNSVNGIRIGHNSIEFHDEVGGVCEWNNAALKISGILINERVISFIDEVNFIFKAGEREL